MDMVPTCENGFTGLEAAIVLIAFVVVAASFSYVVLGAGFFTSQTAQSTVHTGVSQASSSMELVGNTYGIADSSGTYLDYVNVTVALTAGGTPIDLSSMVVSYTDNNKGHEANLTYGGVAGDSGGSCPAPGNAVQWCIAQKINNVTAGAILDNNAQMVILVALPTTATPNTQFSINFQPSVGAVLPIIRTIPGGLTAVQPLY
jgi:archaeal flagellin FlaB